MEKNALAKSVSWLYTEKNSSVKYGSKLKC